jgi:carboxyl-terminal processing protease
MNSGRVLRLQRTKFFTLVLAFGMVAGCESLIVTAPESNQNVADFEVAWAWVDSVYPVFDLKQIDWDSVYAEYHPRAELAQGDEILQVLHDMLSVLKDPHLYYLTNGGARFFPYVSPRLLNHHADFSAQLVRRYFDDELQVACKDGVEYGILNGDVGYIRISHFNEADMMDDFPTVLSSVSGTQGLIIDVRNNTGGESKNVDAVVRMFIEAPMAWPLAFEADGNRVQPWPDIAAYGTRSHYANLIVVLINGASLSSGELFPEVMKQLPNVTVVGDTTAGASCNDRLQYSGDRRLPSGKLVHIPTWCICRYDGVPWESAGIAPDIRVEQTAADVRQRRDRQLEYAIDFLAMRSSSTRER